MKKNNKIKTFFIVFEGPDGAGKSTLIKLLEEKLNQHPFYIFSTEEPQKNLDFRKVLLNSYKEISPLTETLMFILDRHLHLKSLEKWKKTCQEEINIILCDRYFYSTFVYQGLMGGISFEQLKRLHQASEAWQIPDLVFFLNVHNSKLLRHRIKQKQNPYDRFHNKIDGKIPDLIEYYCEVKDYFLAEKTAHPIISINCSKSTQMIIEEMYQRIMKMIYHHELNSS